jgi:hypothetical protein
MNENKMFDLKIVIMKKIFSLLIFGCGFFISTVGQDSTKTKEEAPKPKYVKNTFRSTRIINMQSVEMQPKGYMQFMISHHFGNIWNSGGGAENFAQLLGFNGGVAHTYMAFDYTPINNLNLGVAATGNASFEGWTKIRILRQQTGLKNYPVTVVWHSLFNVDASNRPVDNNFAWNRFSFLHQILIARKFNNKFSLQLMSSLVHYNVAPYGINNSSNNNIFSVGMGGKYAISSKKNLTFEYSRQLNMFNDVLDKSGNIINYEPNLVSIGYEIFTGGHTFQFYIGNTISATNIEQLSRNTNGLQLGQWAIGFHLNRSFSMKKEKE